MSKGWWVTFAICILCVSSRLEARSPQLDAQLNLQSEQIVHEADPRNELACFTMGRISVSYKAGEDGRERVGLRVTDPLGRSIGYDLRTDKGWQQMPLGQAFFTCERNDDSDGPSKCVGHIEICGPLSGDYQMEVLPTESGEYSVSVAATTKVTLADPGGAGTLSRAEVEGETHGDKPEVLVLRYSRNPETQISVTPADQHFAHLAESN